MPETVGSTYADFHHQEIRVPSIKSETNTLLRTLPPSSARVCFFKLTVNVKFVWNVYLAVGLTVCSSCMNYSLILFLRIGKYSQLQT